MLLAFCEKREREREKKKGKWLREDMPLRPSILYHEYRFLGQILMK